MCGFAGVFLPRGAAVPSVDLEAMAASIEHRGPDGDGRFVRSDKLFQTVFRRLSIIDLETGDQPISSADGRHVLVGNGEVYNYIELRDRFPDYPYRTHGDMELILAAHDRLGDEFVHALNGMYAFALYDGSRHELRLVRDRLGVKPLYWKALANGGIVFASEIKAIFASGLATPEIDDAAVGAYLGHGFVPSPDTLFRGVKKLAPGHTLRIDASGRVAIDRYWRAAPAPAVPESADAVAAALTDLLRDSVRMQLRSDVPVGVLLSGGIDSGLLVGIAAETIEEPVNTYTVSFDGAIFDEAPLARLVAERYGPRHTEIRLSTDAVVQHLPNLAWYAEEPLNDAALLPNYLIERALGERVKVALNGTGGDELFAGYGRYFQLPVEKRYLKLPAWVRRSLIEPVAGLIDPMTGWRLARSEKFHLARGDYMHDHACHFPAPLRRMIGNRLEQAEPAQQKFFREYMEELSGDRQSAALYADLNTYLPEDLLTLLDRTSMAASVEGRVPFLDHRLVELALSVPEARRTPGGMQKGIERRIAAP